MASNEYVHSIILNKGLVVIGPGAGGCGKTFFAEILHLACKLADTSVRIIDGDLAVRSAYTRLGPKDVRRLDSWDGEYLEQRLEETFDFDGCVIVDSGASALGVYPYFFWIFNQLIPGFIKKKRPVCLVYMATMNKLGQLQEWVRLKSHLENSSWSAGVVTVFNKSGSGSFIEREGIERLTVECGGRTLELDQIDSGMLARRYSTASGIDLFSFLTNPPSGSKRAAEHIASKVVDFISRSAFTETIGDCRSSRHFEQIRNMTSSFSYYTDQPVEQSSDEAIAAADAEIKASRRLLSFDENSKDSILAPPARDYIRAHKKREILKNK